MAEIKKSSGSAKRFGVRYGRTIRSKIGAIERDSRAKHPCPYCAKKKAKRLSSGIWHCLSCKAKFSGAAYTVKREVKSSEEVQHG